MKKFFLIILTTLFSASAFAHAPVADLVENVNRGVVNLQVTQIREQTVSLGREFDDFFGFFGFGFPAFKQKRKLQSGGSGFFLDKKGYLVTNAHVAAGADEIIAILHNQKRLKAKIIGYDRKYDLALLKVERSRDYIGLDLGNSDKIRKGEDVVAIGNPFGLENTVTKGIISAKHRTIGAGPYDDFIQTDAAINPGNSGGPMFDMKGDVIGVNTAVAASNGRMRAPQGIGFAIPINSVKEVVPQLKKHGRVLRKWLGIVADNVAAYPPRYMYGQRLGVVIVNLFKGGPAARKGLEIGDIIVEANRKKIKHAYDLELAVSKKKKILLKIVRKNKTFIKLVPLEIIPQEEKLPRGYSII